jgi:hypothetical protein
MGNTYLTTRKEAQECMKEKKILWTVKIDLHSEIGTVFKCIIDEVNVTSGKSMRIDKWMPKRNKVLCCVKLVVPNSKMVFGMAKIRPIHYLFYTREGAIMGLNRFWKYADIEEDRT